MTIQSIIDSLGFNFKSVERVGGGDINDAYCISTDKKKYFLKVNDANRYPNMFEREASGLKALKNGSAVVIPDVIRCGVTGSQQFLILEWLEKGRPGKDFWRDFGHALAEMHKKPQAFFGFDEDNYIGSLPQKNTKHDTWESFYTECRIMPLVTQLKNQGSFSPTDARNAENFCNKIKEIFPTEPPSLLHGDLWSGNYMIVENGAASIYDPAVYYGHREMDLGMTLLFGGFSQPFYDHYDEAYPLEKNWRQRVRYTQLYPLLVHAILFGGHYVGSVREILREFG